MADEIKQVVYHYVITADGGGTVAGIVNALCDKGIGLVAFSSFPGGEGRTQLDLVPEDAEALAGCLQGMGLAVSPKKLAFLIHADDGACAVSKMIDSLAEARIPVTSVQAISTGALLWVKQEDVRRAWDVMGAAQKDGVDEASEESFPASDAPAWVF